MLDPRVCPPVPAPSYLLGSPFGFYPHTCFKKTLYFFCVGPHPQPLEPSTVLDTLRLRRWRKGSSEAGNEFLWQPVYLPDLDIPIRRIYYQKFVLGEDQRGGGGQILPFWAPEACVLSHAAGSAISECLFEMMGRVMGNAWEPKLDYEIRCF